MAIKPNPVPSGQVTNKLENNYIACRSSSTGVKVLCPTSGSPARRSGNSRRSLKESRFEGHWSLTAGIPQAFHSWRYTKGLVSIRTQGKSSDPIRAWTKHTSWYQRVSCGSGVRGGSCSSLQEQTQGQWQFWRVYISVSSPGGCQDLEPLNSLQGSLLKHHRSNNQQGKNTAPPISRQAA